MDEKLKKLKLGNIFRIYLGHTANYYNTQILGKKNLDFLI